MTACPVVITDWRPWLFWSCPVSGRDAVTARPWPLAWTYNGRLRRAELPEDWRFGVATDKVPGFAMAIIRAAVNFHHMQRSSAWHDLLYATQGGRRSERTCSDELIYLPFDDVSREEADWLAYAIAVRDGIHSTQAAVVHWALTRFGQGAWDE